MPQKVVFATCSPQAFEGKKFGMMEIPELDKYLKDGYKVVDFKQMTMPASTEMTQIWFDVVFILEK